MTGTIEVSVQKGHSRIKSGIKTSRIKFGGGLGYEVVGTIQVQVQKGHSE